MYNVLKSSQGIEVLVNGFKTSIDTIIGQLNIIKDYLLSVTKSLNSVSNFLVSIDTHTSNSANYLNTINKYIIDIFSYISNISDYVRTISEYFETIYFMELQYINAMSDFLGLNFGINDSAESIEETFTFSIDETLHQLVVNAMTEVENFTNPLSEQNKPAFDSALKSLNDNTIIGNVNDIKDTGQTMLNSLSGANPSAHYYVTTLPVSFCGVTIPAKTIDIDLSWYGAYREQAFTILRSLILIGWFVIFFRRLPDLINGSGLSEFKQHNDDLADDYYEIVRSQQERGIGSE